MKISILERKYLKVGGKHLTMTMRSNKRGFIPILDLFEPFIILLLIIFAFSALAFVFFKEWENGNYANIVFLILALISGIIVVVSLTLLALELSGYIDLPFKGPKKDKSGRTRCRVCYQFKFIENGDVCDDCQPYVLENIKKF